MTKNIFTFISFLLIISCNSNVNNIIEEEEEENQEFFNEHQLNLESDITSGNIFEPFTFKLDSNFDENILSDYFTKMFYMDEKFDSIVLKIADKDGSYKVFYKENDGNLFLSNYWRHYFYEFGTYELKLFGYKNNNIIFQDNIFINVNNNYDYINFNWDNFVQDNNSIGYIDCFSNSYFSMYKGNFNETHFADLRLSWEDIYQDPQSFSIEHDRLNDFIIKTYGNPQYNFETNPNLTTIYEDNFQKPLYNNIPYYIWITTKTKIVLLKEYSQTDPNFLFGCLVHAEPNE